MKSLGSLVIGKAFIGTDEFRKKLTHILQILATKRGEIIVTQHGQPVGVFMDVATYSSLQKKTKENFTPITNVQNTTRLYTSNTPANVIVDDL